MEIGNLKQEQYSSVFIDYRLTSKIKEKLDELNTSIISSFSFTKQEKDLLNYAVEVTVPVLMKHEEHERLYQPLPLKSNILTEYINLFFARFNGVYERLYQKLVAQVRHTNQIVGLFFKLVSLYSNEDSIIWTETNDQGILQLLSSLGVEKLTNNSLSKKM